MNWLRNYLDKVKPNFQKGGKLEKLHSTFDAFETFLFVPNKVTTTGAHIRDSIDMKRTMTFVIIALLPTLLAGMYNVGYQYYQATGQLALAETTTWAIFLYGILKVVPIIVVSYVTGLTIEFISAQLRGHEVNEGFLVTGMLIPLVMPPDVPLWMVAISTAFAVIIGKEVFGGTGMNIVNPALLTRAFLFFAYPAYMSGDIVWTSGLTSGTGIIDGYSGATLLSQAANYKMAFTNGLGESTTIADMFFGFIPGSIGETSKFAIILGAVFLLITGIANWRIMLSTILGALAFGLLLNLVAVNPFMELPAYMHLLMGGFLFGAIFMATDPVTGTQTNTGKWIYGFLIGAFAILIRVLNPAYPEGMMLSILLMNIFAPLIDYIVIQSNIKRRMKRNRQIA